MKPLLLIAQPGHELKILGWLKTYLPDVIILTQGEGSIRSARLDQSTLLIHELGLRIRTDCLSPLPDQEVYRSILNQEGGLLLKHWFKVLYDFIKAEHITALVADSAEGCNPIPDLCRVLANQLTKQLCQEGHEILNLEFPLLEHPQHAKHNNPPKIEIHLSPEQLKDKIDLARHYGIGDQRLTEKIEMQFTRFGEEAFKIESLYPAEMTDYEKNKTSNLKPHFETIGEQRKKEGLYSEIITAEHLRKAVQQFQHEKALMTSRMQEKAEIYT